MAAELLRYYRDDSRTAWFRRAAIAWTLGTGLAFGIDIVLRVIVHAFPSFSGRYADAAKGIQYIPETAKQLPWGFWGALAVATLIWAILMKTKLTRKLDFILFASFDADTLEAVTRYTGMLRWHLPVMGETREIWERLLGWVMNGSEFERAQSRFPPGLIKASPKVRFAWTILTGPNASGKTQMAKELGRLLGRRLELGDGEGITTPDGNRARRRLRFSQWRARLSRIDCRSIAWDTGCITKKGHQPDGYRLERLKEWLPRAPTLLILDDPPSEVCGVVIQSLTTRAQQFRFPVRLLIVDQFIPSDVPIVKNTERAGWHHKDSASIQFDFVFLKMPKFDLSDVRQTLAKGYWIVKDGKVSLETVNDLPALYKSRDLEKLVDAVEGHPMFLALAIHWVRRPGRSVDKLLDVNLVDQEERELAAHPEQDIRAVVAHRLLADRIEELYDSFKVFDRAQPDDKAALRKSLACATIAGEISRKNATDRFKLRADPTDLHRLFPELVDSVRELPALKPWMLGERFVRKVERDVFFDDVVAIDDFVREVLLLNPKGTLKSLSRPGMLRHRIARVLEVAPLPADGNMRLALFGAFAQYSLSNRGAGVAKVLSLVDAADASQVPEMLDRLERLELPAVLADERSDPLAEFTIFCALGAKRLLGDPTTRQKIRQRMEILGRRVSDGPFPDGSPVELACGQLASAMIRTLPTPPSVDEEFEELDRTFRPEWNDASPLSRPWRAGLLTAAREVRPSTPLLDAFVRIGAGIAALLEKKSGDFAPADSVLRDLETLGPMDPLHRDLLRWRLTCFVDISRPDGLDDAVQRGIEQSGELLRRWPGRRLMRLEHADTLRTAVLTQRALGNAERPPERWVKCEAVALELDALGEEFPKDLALQVLRAEAWRSVATTPGIEKQPGASEKIAGRLDAIAALFPDDDRLRDSAMTAWAAAAVSCVSRPRRPADAKRIAVLVDTIEKSGAPTYRSCAARCEAWMAVAGAGSEISTEEAECEAAASRVDAIAEPYPYDRRIQEHRATAWDAVTRSRVDSAARIHLTTEAALRVDAIAAAFPDPVFQRIRAGAWAKVAGARSSLPAQLSIVADAARILDEIAARLPTDRWVMRNRASAWRWVVRARCREEDWTGALEAAETVDMVVASSEGSRTMVHFRVVSWGWVSWAPSSSLSEESARRIDQIVERFPDDAEFQEERAIAWSNVALRQAEAPNTFARVEDSAHIVDSVCERFDRRPQVQRARALGWLAVAQVRLHQPEHRHLVEEAVEVVDSIGRSVPGEPEIQRMCATAWAIARQARTLLGDHESAARAAGRPAPDPGGPIWDPFDRD